MRIVFSLNFSAQNFVKMSCLFTCSTVSAKDEWGEARVFNFTYTFIVLGLFNCFILFQDCFLRFIHVTGTVWVGYSDVEKKFSRGRQKLWHNTSSLAFSSELALRERISLSLKVSAGSIPTSLHTFDSNSASRSRIALCLRITNSPSWHIIAWSLMFSFPHSHRRWRSLIPHSYLKCIASLNFALLKYIPCSLDSNDVNHVEFLPFAIVLSVSAFYLRFFLVLPRRKFWLIAVCFHIFNFRSGSDWKASPDMISRFL